MQKYVYFIENQTEHCLVLDTLMTESVFASSKLSADITLPGVIYKKASNTFITWTFQEARTQYSGGHHGTVALYFPTEINGTLLCDILENDDRAMSYTAVRNLIAVYQEATEHHVAIPDCGPAGTLIAQNGDITFLPTAIVERILAGRDEVTYARYFSQYRNPRLCDNRATTFTLGAYLYHALCNIFPFPGQTTAEVHTDQSDSNFLRPDYAAPGLTTTIANCITQLLDQQPDAVNAKSQTTKTLTPNISVSTIFTTLPALYDDCFLSITDTERVAITQSANEALMRQTKRIAHIRFARKHKVAIISTACAIIAAILVANNVIETVRSRPTTQGMEPQSVVERFYTAVSELDQQWPQACCAGNAGKALISMTSQVYVTYRQTEFYAKERRLYTPGQWWSLEEPGQRHIFGITHCTITDCTDIQSETNTRRFEVSYFLIVPEIPDTALPEKEQDDMLNIFPLSVFRCKDIVEVSQKKDIWRITQIDTVDKEAINASITDVTAGLIPGKESKEIAWGPTQQEIEDGKASLAKTYFGDAN